MLPLSQIDEPVDRRDHDGAANDIADGDRQQIANQKIAPGQRRKIGRRLADRGPERVRRAGFYEQPHWNEVDVGDAMLEAGGRERCDRRDTGEDFIDNRSPGEAHPLRLSQKCRALSLLFNLRTSDSIFCRYAKRPNFGNLGVDISSNAE